MKKPKNIDDYIGPFSPNVQKTLKQLRSTIRRAAPKATEKIAWGMPTFFLEGNLVHIAAFKNHISLFPGPEAIVQFQKQLKNYPTSKGTIQFPHGDKIPLTLVTRIVKFRVKQNLAKKARKKTKPRLFSGSDD